MRKLMWFAIGFGAACAFGAYFYGDWLLCAGAVAAAAALVFAVVTRWIRPIRSVAVLAMGAAIGFCWFYLYDTIQLTNARQLDGQTERITVIVRDYSYETDYGTAVDGWVELEGKQYKIRLYLDEDLSLTPGNRVIGSFRLSATAGSEEDIQSYRTNGALLTGAQRGNVIVERFWSIPWRCYPAVWREWLRQRIRDCFAEDTIGFAQALLIGDKSGIDYETTTSFRLSGISHIIAVSGLHVSILFGLIFFLAGKRRGLTALVGIPAVLIFAAIAGFSPSITRAAIMQCVMMGAMLLDKEYDPPTSLAFAGLVMLAVEPLVITSVSFQLSFACMIGICLFSQPIRQWLMDKKRLGRWKGKLVSWLSSGISVSLSASIATTPLVAVYFGTVSLVSLVTNLLTVWIISFIFYGILGACLLSLLNMGLARAVAWVTGWAVRYVLWTSGTLAALPLAAVYTQSGYIVAWLIFVYVLLGILLMLRRKPVVLYIGLCVLSLGVCVCLSWVEPMLDTCRVTVLDVGQGQAIILQSQGLTYLVDCGGDYSEETANITAERLLSQGIDRVDGVILTHYDTDHSGGLAYLLTRIDTELLFLPHSLDENGVAEELRSVTDGQIIDVREDLLLTFGSASMVLYAPVSYNSGNESSMCVLFRTEKCDILITGDMGETGERLLMKYHSLPQVDILVVGHHGSSSSTSQALLETVRPRYAFISVGEDNSYGHPDQTVLERLLAFGCVIYRTDENGTIVYRG